MSQATPTPTTTAPADAAPQPGKTQQRYSGRVAVIGMDGWWPGSRNPAQLWSNLLSLRKQLRKIPELRLGKDQFCDTKPPPGETSYCHRAGLIDGFIFDRVFRRVHKKVYEGCDLVHWLMLETAHM
jgi:acyl transferase domain-containing protein